MLGRLHAQGIVAVPTTTTVICKQRRATKASHFQGPLRESGGEEVVLEGAWLLPVPLDRRLKIDVRHAAKQLS